MDQEPQKQSRFFTWVYGPIIAPIIVVLIVSFITGRIVIQITGFQFSIGLTILITLCIFVVMVISFILGMFYFPLVLLSLWLKKVNMPLWFRIVNRFANVLFSPYLWFERRQRKNYQASNTSSHASYSEFTQQMFQPKESDVTGKERK